MDYNLMLTCYQEGEQKRAKYEGIIYVSSIEDKVQVGERVEVVIKEGMGKLGVPKFMYKYVEGTVNLIVGAICSGWVTTEVQHLCSIASNDEGIFRAIDFYVSRVG